MASNTMNVEPSFELKEGLTIDMEHMSRSVTLSSVFVEKTDADEYFMKLDPSRCRHIASIMTSCSEEEHQSMKEFRNLFNGAECKGNQFLKWIKRRRELAIKEQFHVKGKRFMARGRSHRAKQKLLETVEVTLPRLGTAASVTACMKVQTVRKNGKDPVWIKVDKSVLTYLALGFDHVIKTDGACVVFDDTTNDEIEVNREGGAMTGAEVAATVDDAVQDVNDDTSMAAADPMEQPPAVVVHDRAQTPPREPSEVMKASALFAAFQRGVSTP